VRQLLPPGSDRTDLLDLYGAAGRTPPSGRPWVLLNMVASVDGATAVDGVTASLGGAADKAVFGVIRTLADAILVGAGTARTEGYRPPRAPAGDAAEARRARGQTPRPRLAVVSRRLDLDPALPFLDDDPPPWLVTTEDPPADALARLADRVEPVQAGRGAVDLGAALGLLHAQGVRVVLCEGGPTLNAELAAHDLVDELCLTIAPHVVGGGTDRIVGSIPAVPAVRDLRLAHVLEADDHLLLRYVRVR
jgi:riboflavin-specific deaminase-like protein